jgi:hypothetical protein
MSLGAIGIGLGGFMDGYQKGQQIRQERKRSEYLDGQAERQKKLDARADADYARDEKQRQDIAAIGTQAQEKFDSAVKAGTQQPGDFDTFWSSYAVPKLSQTYIANGDLDNARKVQAWGDSAEAKAGGKLAMGALLKAQTGDTDGALADVMKAGQMKGYIDHGYEVLGHDNLAAPDGSVAGYRLRLKTPDGKEVEQDIQKADMPRLIATFLNPEAAWQSQVEARAATAKDAKDLDQYEAKKKIDKQYGTGENKTRGDAISALRKRMDGGIAGNETKFDDLSRQEQEKLIASEIDLQGGQPGLSADGPVASAAPSGPSRKVIVDTATGKPVAAAPQQQQPQQTPSAQQPAPKQTREDNVTYLLQSADEAVKSGENPQRIAQELLNNGIPREQWPESLGSALAVSSRNQIGLGR